MATPITNPYKTLFTGPVEMNLLLPETRAVMQAQFSSTAPAEHGGQWDDLWKKGIVPW